MGAIKVWGRVGTCLPPAIVMPLSIEPSKPCLVHDQQYLNCFMRHCSLSLDQVVNLPSYLAHAGRTGDPRGPHLALQATWFSPASKTPVAMESVDFPYRKQIVRLTLLNFLQLAPQQYTIWKPVIQTKCFRCFSPNNLPFLFCQQCGTPRQHTTPPDKASKAPLINSHPLAARWEALKTYIAVSKSQRNVVP